MKPPRIRVPGVGSIPPGNLVGRVKGGRGKGAAQLLNIDDLLAAARAAGGGGAPLSGITQLTGDVTAGPATGTTAATLANTAVTPGSYTYASITVNGKGLLTAASSGAAPVSSANPTATISGSAVNGSATTYMRSDAAPALANTAVTAGSYTYSSITVDAQGRLTAASSGAAPVSSANPTASVSGSAVNGSATTYMRSDAAPALAATAVTAGSYTYGSFTVDAQGRLTAASSGSAPASAANPTATVSGSAVNGSASTYMRSDAAPALANTAVTAGSYTYGSFTVDAQGRLTAASSGTAPASAANPTATVSGSAVNGSAATFMRSDGAPALANTAVTAGSYTAASITVDAQGRLTSASSGTSTTIAAVGPPQGRLTLTSATPVMAADVTAATTIYYDSYVGNLVPVGGVALSIGSDQISMGLDAGVPHILANNVYDIFAISNSGTLVIAAGPAWINTATITVTIATPAVVSWASHGLLEGATVVFTTSGALPTGITAGTTYFVSRSPAAGTFNISTTLANAAAGTLVATSGTQSGTHTGTNGTSVRGTGAGTTELQLSGGVWTNKNSLTHAWGGASGTTDYGTVAANAGTYLGSLYATASGQTAMMFLPAGATGGSDNVLGLYNAYNRTTAISIERDSGSSWTLAVSGGWSAAHANVKNRITYLDGLAQSSADAAYIVAAAANAGVTTVALSGVTFGSTNGSPVALGTYSGNATVVNANITAVNSQVALGLTYAQAVEQAVTNTAKFFGGSGQMYLTLKIAI